MANEIVKGGGATAAPSQSPAIKAIEVIRQARGAEVVRVGVLANGDIELQVKPDALLPVAQFLRDDPRLDFQYFNFSFGTDRIDYLEVVCIVNSLIQGLRLQLKTRVLPNEAKIASLTSVWRGANWHERETFDMLGITFEGHPYHHRMFLDEDFEGYPLRKSFKLAGRAD